MSFSHPSLEWFLVERISTTTKKAEKTKEVEPEEDHNFFLFISFLFFVKDFFLNSSVAFRSELSETYLQIGCCARGTRDTLVQEQAIILEPWSLCDLMRPKGLKKRCETFLLVQGSAWRSKMDSHFLFIAAEGENDLFSYINEQHTFGLDPKNPCHIWSCKNLPQH